MAKKKKQTPQANKQDKQPNTQPKHRTPPPETGAPEAKKITAKFGLAKIAEAKEEHFDAIFDLCEAKLAEPEEDEGNSEEDDV